VKATPPHLPGCKCFNIGIQTTRPTLRHWPDRTRLRREWYGPCSAERLPQPCEPLAWRIETVRRNELYVAPLIDAVRARGYHLATVAMDKGSDNSRVMDDTRERSCVPIVCLGQGTAETIDRKASVNRRQRRALDDRDRQGAVVQDA